MSTGRHPEPPLDPPDYDRMDLAARAWACATPPQDDAEYLADLILVTGTRLASFGAAQHQAEREAALGVCDNVDAPIEAMRLADLRT